MGNHLRELVEAVDAMEHAYYDGMETQSNANLAVMGVHSLAPQAICFDLGTDYGVANPVAMPPVEMARLPYPVCWFESTYSDHGIVAGFLCRRSQSVDGAIDVWSWRREKGLWFCINAWECDPSDGQSIYFKSLAPTSSWSDEDATEFLGALRIVFAAIGVLNCSNIVTRRHDPDAKLQKARAKRGKQPLFSYHTLEIDPTASREAGVDMGGTHASPRVHLRRGHIRQFAPGRYCWVRESVVRGTTPGIVHKDYAVRPALH